MSDAHLPTGPDGTPLTVIEDGDTGDRFLVYVAKDGVRAELRVLGETFWATRAQMAEMFDIDARTVSYHLTNVFSEGELLADSVSQESWLTAADGKRYRTNLYSLDAMISVGYRVSSRLGTMFRIGRKRSGWSRGDVIRRPSKLVIGLGIGLALIAIYYAFAASGVAIYADVCSERVQGQPDKCAYYDVVSALIGRFFIISNEYGAAVAGLAGVAVAFFTGVLWYATEKLWGESNRQRLDARHAIYAGQVAARAALKSARAAEVTALAARQQSEWAGRQTDILDAQKTIARLQYFAEHRPRIVLKDVYFTRPTDFASIIYEFANIGGSGAHIIDGFIRFDCVSDSRTFKNQIFSPMGITPPIFEAGTLKTFVSEEMTAHVLSQLNAEKLPHVITAQEERSRYYFYGMIHYVDERGEGAGVKRLAVFRRMLTRMGWEFLPPADDPYEEYSD